MSNVENQEDLNERVKAATLLAPYRPATRTFTTSAISGVGQPKETPDRRL